MSMFNLSTIPEIPGQKYIESFCGEKLLDPNFFNYPTIPAVTQCMAHTIFVWIPTLLVYCFAPLIIYQTSLRRKDELPWTQLLSAKFTITIVLMIDTFFIFLYNLYDAAVSTKMNLVDFVYPLMLSSSMFLMILFLLACQKYGRITSGPIHILWVTFALCGIPELYYWFHANSSTINPMPIFMVPRYISYIIWYIGVATQVVLFSFADTPGSYEKLSYENDENISPETFSSFLNRQTLWWFNSLCSLGKSKSLELNDLFNLNKNDQSETLVPIWEKLWSKAMKKYQKEVEKERKMKKKKRLSMNDIFENIGVRTSHQDRDTQPLLSNDVLDTTIESSTESSGQGISSNTTSPDRNTSYGSTEHQSYDNVPTTVKPPSILKRLFIMFRYDIIIAMSCKLISDLLQFVNPQLLKKLIAFIKVPDAPLWYGFLLATGMFLASEFSSLFLNYYYYQAYRLGTRIQTVLTAAVYKKTLKLSNTARKDKTAGEIVNLMAIDVDRFQHITPQTHQYISTPFQMILAMIFLYQLMGISVISGIFIMLMLFPINFIFSLIIRDYQSKQMNLKDERVKMVNEVLNGIKVIKLYAWEIAMEDVIKKLRNKELVYIKKASFLRTTSDMINQAGPFLVALSTFATYIFIDSKNILTPEIAFVSLTLFNQLRSPMSTIAELISTTVQVMVSNKRLKEFFVAEEINSKIQRNFKNGMLNDLAIHVKNATFKWEKKSSHEEDSNTFTLKNLNLKAEKGSFIAVVGKVGNGKSSVLQSLLGEMELISGKVKIDGQVAYIPQQAWMQNNTVRGNITFGSKYDEYYYERVLTATCLIDDLSSFVNYDLTEIGEKGINLSGGQKARISLARAVYQNFDIYLLDDPLSAVDAHVGAKIFNDVIGPEGLLRNKTRILVTNELNYMNYTDQILVVENGEIVLQGSYDELVNKEEFQKLLKECETEKIVVEEDIEETGSLEEFENNYSDTESDNIDDDTQVESFFGTSHMSTVSAIYTQRKISMATPKQRKRRLSVCSKSHISTDIGFNALPTSGYEKAETGKVKLSVYIQYFNSMGYIISFFFVIGLTLSTTASIFRSLWLTDWSNDNAKGTSQNTTTIITPIKTRLGVYALIGFSEIFLMFIGLSSILLGGILASRNLHAPLLHAIFRAPMSFFDITPFGRIINRINKDIETVDFLLPFNVQFFVSCILQVLSTLIIIILSTPSFTFVAIPLGIMYFYVLKYYINTSRQLKRLESITRSPIYSHLSESIQGAFTIRSYRLVNKFCKLSEQKVDTHVRCRYLNYVANRWLTVRLEFIGNCIVLFAALLGVLMKSSVSPGLIGLSVSYALNITFCLNFAVRQISKLETNIVSVERIKEYSEIKQEAAWESTKDRQPMSTWPEEGNIEFLNYSTRYRPGLDLVLRRVCAKIKPRERIGIVGRTGAGKSSITLSLFRMVEPVEGTILIDGVDISRIGLHDLRNALTIIPQDPVLFSGSLRFNLDPFNHYTDEVIWNALEKAHLKNFALSNSEGLDFMISESAGNISLGTCQLLCLARAILRKTKILILDEATASVDMHTDALIQQTIAKEFAHANIIVIAHRLSTILDYDRIIVLDFGQIVEFDTPANLLANKRSIFYSMVKRHEECSNGGNKKRTPNN
uniref:Multidrug resistance-associated protein 1 n=1 Tax=Parastrongyloides trichosuri TaxID=131310 RepID=A0A0N4ZYR9_PARTI